MNDKQYVYLACPYSHEDPQVREQRFNEANICAGKLMDAGFIVYSPISHSHPIAVAHDLPKGWSFWGRIDETFVHFCTAVFILKLPGWEESTGVKAEMELAAKYGKPILFLSKNS